MQGQIQDLSEGGARFISELHKNLRGGVTGCEDPAAMHAQIKLEEPKESQTWKLRGRKDLPQKRITDSKLQRHNWTHCTSTKKKFLRQISLTEGLRDIRTQITHEQKISVA